VLLLIQILYLASDEAFKKDSCVAPRHNCGGQMWRIRWALLHLQTVSMQALFSDTCCVHRAPCISLNLPLCPAAVDCSLHQNL